MANPGSNNVLARICKFSESKHTVNSIEIWFSPNLSLGDSAHLRMMTGFLNNRTMFIIFSQLYSIDGYKWYPKYLCHPLDDIDFWGKKSGFLQKLIYHDWWHYLWVFWLFVVKTIILIPKIKLKVTPTVRKYFIFNKLHK